jgi:hypothetical protein
MIVVCMVKEKKKRATFVQHGHETLMYKELFSFLLVDGQSNVEVELLTKNYVEKGSSVTLYCRHNFALESIYKVNKCNRVFLN